MGGDKRKELTHKRIEIIFTVQHRLLPKKQRKHGISRVPPEDLLGAPYPDRIRYRRVVDRLALCGGVDEDILLLTLSDTRQKGGGGEEMPKKKQSTHYTTGQRSENK